MDILILEAKQKNLHQQEKTQVIPVYIHVLVH